MEIDLKYFKGRLITLFFYAQWYVFHLVGLFINKLMLNTSTCVTEIFSPFKCQTFPFLENF
jgi:hypothetical protein